MAALEQQQLCITPSNSSESSCSSNPKDGSSTASSKRRRSPGPSFLSILGSMLPAKRASERRSQQEYFEELLLNPLPVSKIPVRYSCGDDYCISGISHWIDAYMTRLKVLIAHSACPRAMLNPTGPDFDCLERGKKDTNFPKARSRSLDARYMKGQHDHPIQPTYRNYINLIINWEGYPLQEHRILVRCQCGVDDQNFHGSFVTRRTLAFLVAVHCMMLFTTHKPSKASKFGDLGLPETFSRLRLLCLWSSDRINWNVQLGYVTEEKSFSRDGELAEYPHVDAEHALAIDRLPGVALIDVLLGRADLEDSETRPLADCRLPWLTLNVGAWDIEKLPDSADIIRLPVRTYEGDTLPKWALAHTAAWTIVNHLWRFRCLGLDTENINEPEGFLHAFDTLRKIRIFGLLDLDSPDDADTRAFMIHYEVL
ncbi:hypothetical protein EYR38_008041 [Pleurotus pulmonarius]|nr:hypothetical protein EYR38_008041 [Pleurotus pulmonarius]